MTGFIPAVIPVKTGIQNVGSRRIIRTSLPLDLRVKPEDDRGERVPRSSPKMTKGEKLRRGPKMTVEKQKMTGKGMSRAGAEDDRENLSGKNARNRGSLSAYKNRSAEPT